MHWLPVRVGDGKDADAIAPAPEPEPGGVVDSAFGRGGTAVHGADSNDTVNAILGTGADATISIGSSLSSGRPAFVVMRVRGDGSLDPSFGAGGRTVTTIGDGGAEALAATYSPDGKIIVAGSAADADGSDADFAVARYLADGSPDATFGSGGVTLHKVSDAPDAAFAVALDGAGGSSSPASAGGPISGRTPGALPASHGSSRTAPSTPGSASTAFDCSRFATASNRCEEWRSTPAGGSSPAVTARTAPPTSRHCSA